MLKIATSITPNSRPFPSRTVFYTWVNIRCKLPRSLGQNSVQINIVITDLSGATAGRTRPLCEYPAWPKYVSGDTNSAASFTCTQ
ncbi:tannase/feruloyl esterase family alpha/beta hydrolase [Cupriavidus basilensis]